MGGSNNSTNPGNPTPFINNPGQYQAYNTTPQYNNTMAQIGQNTGNQQQALQGRLSAQGAGRSGSAAAGLNQIAAQGQQIGANTAAGLGQFSFGNQLAQENAANQYNLGAYNAQAGNYNNQADRESNQLSSSLGTLGTLGALFLA